MHYTNLVLNLCLVFHLTVSMTLTLTSNTKLLYCAFLGVGTWYRVCCMSISASQSHQYKYW